MEKRGGRHTWILSSVFILFWVSKVYAYRDIQVKCGDTQCTCTNIAQRTDQICPAPETPIRQCQLPGEPCNNVSSCCQQAQCINETICCGLDGSICSITSDCCQDEPRNCVERVCIRTNNTVIFNRAGSYRLTVPSQFTNLMFNACGAGGGGAAAFTGNNGAGGGSGACIFNVPFFGISGAQILINIGRGGAGGVLFFPPQENEVVSGADGQPTNVSFPSFGFTQTLFAGAGGGTVGGGGGGSGSSAVGQMGGAGGPPFFAPGGDGGNGGPPQSTIVVANFESGAGGGAGEQNGGSSQLFPGGQACITAVGSQGGGAASRLAAGGSGSDSLGLCGTLPDGSLGSGGGSVLDGTGGRGGDGVVEIQFST